MDRKERAKLLRRFLARTGIKFCSLTLARLPLSMLYKIAEVIAILGYFLAEKQRAIVRENLVLAFGRERSEREIHDFIKANFLYIAKSTVELISLIENPLLLKRHVFFSGKDKISNALKKGKGVIAVSAHFGNFPLMVTRFALEGYRTNLVVRQLRDEKVDKMLFKKRKNLGINSIYNKPRITCVNNCMEALRKNEVVIMQIDQNFGSGSGVFVDFFGKKAATPTGPVILALKTGASIVPVFIVREKNNDHIVLIEKEFDIEQKITYNDTVLYNIQRLTGLIESYIRQYPEEWSWIHRRWKTQPRTADVADKP